MQHPDQHQFAVEILNLKGGHGLQHAGWAMHSSGISLMQDLYNVSVPHDWVQTCQVQVQVLLPVLNKVVACLQDMCVA